MSCSLVVEYWSQEDLESSRGGNGGMLWILRMYYCFIFVVKIVSFKFNDNDTVVKLLWQI